MNFTDMRLFRAGLTFFVKLPDEKFFSITVMGRADIIDELPLQAVALKEYPYIGVENMPPSSTLSTMKIVLMVAHHFAVKKVEASTEEKSAP